MSSEQNKAAVVYAPGEDQVLRFATSTTATTYALPDNWEGTWLTIKAMGTGETAILFGDSTVTVDVTAVNSTTPPAITLSDTVGYPMANGEVINVQVQPGQTHFALDADGAGEIVIWKSGASTR